MGDLNKNVPRLRFPGYTDAWVKCEFATFIERINISSDSDLIPKVEFEDIKSGMGYLNKDISRKFDDRKGTLFQPKDILFGKLRPYLKNWLFPDFTGVALGDFWVFRALNSNPEFAYVLIQSPKFQAIANDTAGTKMPRSDWKIVSNSEFWMPSIKEQTKIGEFFKHLDNLITVNERELNKLKDLKKSYLEKMFPKNGSDIPELRFPGYADAWVKCTIGELAEIVRGSSPRPIQNPKWFDVNSEIGWLKISNVTEQNGRIFYLEQRISTLAQEKTRVLFTPHLLLSIAATVGKPVINYVKTGVHDGFLIFLNPKFEQEFMFQWLEAFRSQWQRYGQPGSQVNLNSDLVRSQEIYVPSIQEQYKIGKFLHSIDDLITVNERELNKLKELKKSYLKDMFV